jgi:hypothetical protein
MQVCWLVVFERFIGLLAGWSGFGGFVYGQDVVFVWIGWT